MTINTARKIILLCTGFNLIAEYSARGLVGFFYQLLPVWLFLAYFTFFHMILHVSSVTGGSDKAVLLSAMTLGLPYIFFSTGTAFFTSEIAGFLIITFTIMFFMWGLTQTWLPLSAGGHIFGWNVSEFRLSLRGWAVCIAYLILFMVFSFPGAIKAPLYLYAVSFGVILLFAYLTLREVNRSKNEFKSVGDNNIVNDDTIPKNPSMFIPVWFIITSGIGLISGTLIPLYFESLGTERLYYPTAFILMTFWTIVTGVLLLLDRKRVGAFRLPY
ncbi:MAG: hypothetical protein AM325_006660 [Candidatus Thorarchaeota archaeon SMTZ1-45]|nr:MAG: hypothetical protein AM325_08410 [Candidatus Thorarchaeota archaeon SMTZ1-45]